MKNLAKVLISIGIGLMVAGLILMNWKCQSPAPHSPTVMVDTSKYTDVVLINQSKYDSVEVFVTLQGNESIIGLFGMDSSDIVAYCIDSIPCVGSFWAHKGVEYHLGDSSALTGVIVTWGVQNQACSVAQTILDSNGKQLFPFGINNFEFTVNTWWQKGKVTGAGESFDITCVDGLHSTLQQSVTSFGPRNEDGLNPNFGSFWDFGYKDSTGQLEPFYSSVNGASFEECVNIPGIFPYGCDWGYKSFAPPTPCNSPRYPVICSTKWGQINTSQTNRQGQGGQIICEFIGFTKDLQPALK